MTVTGTEQRVYGTLTGGCIIDLHRFALVSGSTTQSPTEASTVTYADTTPYKQCGYKYSGYITLFLSISGSSVYAAVEVRICKNDPKRIVIETYGEVAKTVTGGMALWFNKGTDAEPDWVKLNSTTSGVIMPYATTSYTFRETKRNGATTIDCCKKCPACGCLTCGSILERLYVFWAYYNPSIGTSIEYLLVDDIDPSTWTAWKIHLIDPSLYDAYVTLKTEFSNDGTVNFDFSQYTRYFSFEYKLSCENITFGNFKTSNWDDKRDYIPPYDWYYGIYYVDDDGKYKLLAKKPLSRYVNNLLVYYSELPFDYLKNCTNSMEFDICKNVATNIDYALTNSNSKCLIDREFILKNTQGDNYEMSGWYKATIESVDVSNNSMVFKNIYYYPHPWGDTIPSSRLSDRSYSILNGTGSELFTYVAYSGPPIGKDIFFISDVSIDITITGEVGSSPIFVSAYIAYIQTIGPDNYKFYRCGYGSCLIPKEGGSAIFTMSPQICSYTDALDVKCKSNVSFYYEVLYAPSSYSININYSNVQVLNCRYEPYVESDIIPNGGYRVYTALPD